MTTPDPDIAAIAEGLTEAQREGLLRKPCPSWWGESQGCFPCNRATTRALYRKGLIFEVMPHTSAAQLSLLGLAVRDHILRSGR